MRHCRVIEVGIGFSGSCVVLMRCCGEEWTWSTSSSSAPLARWIDHGGDAGEILAALDDVYERAASRKLHPALGGRP